SMAIILVNKPSGNSDNMAKRASSTSPVTSLAMSLVPYNSICNAVPPNVVNQMIASSAGTRSTPPINPLIVRPREILAINNPINGAQEMCQAQKNIVFLPSQPLSEKGVSVKLIGITFEI